MSRRVVLFVVFAVVVVVGAAVALVATARPALDDDRKALDRRWTAVREPLDQRYAGLDQVVAALADGGAGERTYTVDLADELGRWDALMERDDPDVTAEAATANRLEGLATRVRVNVARSARLSRDPAIGDAFAAFDTALVAPTAVDDYNRAARRYQRTRTETLKRLPADLLGYDAPTVLVLAGESAG